MAYYKLTRCPYCNHHIPSEFLKKGGWNDLDNVIGHPSGTCHNCGKTYSTGKQKWSSISPVEKIGLFARMTLGIAYGGVVYTIVLILILFGIDHFFNFDLLKDLLSYVEENPIYLLYFLIPNVGWMIFTHIFELKALIKKYP